MHIGNTVTGTFYKVSSKKTPQQFAKKEEQEISCPIPYPFQEPVKWFYFA
jgi:hypothetical protein